MSISHNFVADVRTPLLFWRSKPAQHGETFDGPPTLERSGSEHRVGWLHPRFLRTRGLGRKWSSPCRRDGEVEKLPL